MRVLRGLVLLAVGAAAALAVDRVFLGEEGRPVPPPPVTTGAQEPDDPPVVWLQGTLREVAPDRLMLREGEGPEIRVERFAEGATAFLRPAGDRWQELGPAQVERLEPGARACVEALLHDGTFLAVRVFLGAGCGPA